MRLDQAETPLVEYMVLEAQDRFPETTFGAVRFGNVLGSNGSVVPLFRRQIEEGKPLTVTHPEISRYFMTIAEAVQLVLQASLLPELRGNVAMLDMGEPVRIVHLAKRLLRLSGSPGRIGRDIVFTGLRPGEKIHERLVSTSEKAMPTSIPKVNLVQSVGSIGTSVMDVVRKWEQAAGEASPDQDVFFQVLAVGLEEPSVEAETHAEAVNLRALG